MTPSTALLASPIRWRSIRASTLPYLAPSTLTAPAVGHRVRPRMDRSVVLPEPFAPITTHRSPGWIVRSSGPRMVRPARRTTRSWTVDDGLASCADAVFDWSSVTEAGTPAGCGAAGLRDRRLGRLRRRRWRRASVWAVARAWASARVSARVSAWRSGVGVGVGSRDGTALPDGEADGSSDGGGQGSGTGSDPDGDGTTKDGTRPVLGSAVGTRKQLGDGLGEPHPSPPETRAPRRAVRLEPAVVEVARPRVVRSPGGARPRPARRSQSRSASIHAGKRPSYTFGWRQDRFAARVLRATSHAVACRRGTTP